MQHRRTSIARPVAWTGTAVALAALAAAVISGFGHSADLWHYRLGFMIFRWSAYIAAGAGVVALAGAIAGAIAREKQPILVGAVGLAAALTLVVPAWYLEQSGKHLPHIHDVTTDTENPPQFVALLPLRQKTPNGPEYGGQKIAQQQRVGYPDIQPLTLNDAPDRAFEHALRAARDMGWEIIASVAGEGRIEATATTRWFRFKDDVIVRVRPDGTGSRIDVRSKSRLGRSDLGANAKRIRAYMQKLKG